MGALSKGTQAIAVEVADYSKKAFEDSTAAMEKLFGVKSLDKAIEVQTEYVKTAYEGFVARRSSSATLCRSREGDLQAVRVLMAKAK